VVDLAACVVVADYRRRTPAQYRPGGLPHTDPNRRRGP
jgi:hypothetical protein